MEFELTEDHIMLLQESEWNWNDSCFGAPGIDPKRPFGNSSGIACQIAEILDWEPQDKDADGDACFSSDQKGDACDIWSETLTAIHVILSARSFTPGLYIYEKDKWVLNNEEK